MDFCRIAFFGLLLCLFAETRWDEYAQVAPELYRGPGPAPGPWLPWIHWLWLLSLATSCLGLATRLSTALAFTLGAYLLGLDWSFGNTHHAHHLILLCLGALAGAKCGQRYSLDSRLAPGHCCQEGWPVRLCQLLWCLTFFNAGLAKLRHSGLDFASADNFQHILLLTRLGYAGTGSWASSLILHHDWLASALAGAALLLELVAPLAFFYAGWPRFLIVAGLAFLQIGASHLMYLKDFRKMAACYVFWIPWGQVAVWLRAKTKKWGRG